MAVAAKLERPKGQESVPDFIRRLIDEAGFNQTDFAERVGLTRQSVNSIVNGATEISPATAHKLQAALKCDGEYLLVLQAKAAFNAAASKPAVDRRKLKRESGDESVSLLPASIVKKVRKLAEMEERQHTRIKDRRRARSKVQKS